MDGLPYLTVIFLYLATTVLASFLFLRKHFERRNRSQSALFLLFIFLLVSLGTGFMVRVDRLDNVAFPPILTAILMTMSLSLLPTIAALWMLYAVNLIYLDEATKRYRNISTIFLVGNLVVSLLSLVPSFNLYFNYDGTEFSRGQLYWLNYLLTYAFYVSAVAIILFNWRRFGMRRTPLFISIIAIPMLGLMLQFFIPDFPFAVMGSTLSFAIVAMNVQYVNATTDYLTGLRNRRSLTNYLSKKISAIKDSSSFSILMFDIDNFKSINDEHGHLIGDEALQHIASFLENNHASDDFVARFGGDEFIIVTDETNEEKLKTFINELRQGFEKNIAPRFTNSPLSFSVGYITFTKNSSLSSVEILTKIDGLMYQDKRSRKTKLKNL